MSALEIHQAVLLHRREWRESSALLEMFSATHGRIGVVARGWRKRAGWAASLQPFQLLSLSWSGRGELQNLRAVESSDQQWLLQGRRLYCGLYMNELLYKLLPRQHPEPAMFECYLRCLAQLASQTPEAVTLRIFEKHLLLALGVALPLSADDAQIDPAAHYRFVPGQGLELTSTVASNSTDCISGDALLALQNEQFTAPGQLAACRRLLRLALLTELDGKPLHSYNLLQ
ncbi:MAG: DNA repair protein RecO [Gammaproteobacteria bacterium]|jgi:DNA repair protein RecO (recombination protein O)|nr:DNA repair protein RecO [Gammaproteobacteria bacterium]